MARRLRIALFAGSFDPPHSGHRDLVERMKKQFDLDLIYVVPDRVQHYKTMQPLEHRVHMTELLFRDQRAVRVLNPDTDGKLGSGELWELLGRLKRRHVRAELFCILGSDALRWYASLPRALRPEGIQMLVNDRHDGASPPPSVDGVSIRTINDLDHGLSSTGIREALHAGQPCKGLTTEVADYIRAQGLYQASNCADERNPSSLPHSTSGSKGLFMTATSKTPCIPTFSIDALRFDRAALVLPSSDRLKASRFVVPIAQFEGDELRYPLRYPHDMRQRDGSPHALAGQAHPKAGRPLEDWHGRPILDTDGSVPRGVVFFNYEDAKVQGVRSSGDAIIIFNRPTEAQASALQAYVTGRGGPSNLNSTDEVLTLLDCARRMGLDDRYDSTCEYARKYLTAVADMATGVPAFGLHLRANEMIRAIFVPGPAQVGDLELGVEGGVFLLISADRDTGERAVRSVSPAAFVDTYTASDGSPITAAELPQERPWDARMTRNNVAPMLS
jgi:nicotinate (nicotinamide) nucleotide adenylyltransferase